MCGGLSSIDLTLTSGVSCVCEYVCVSVNVYMCTFVRDHCVYACVACVRELCVCGCVRVRTSEQACVYVCVYVQK